LTVGAPYFLAENPWIYSKVTESPGAPGIFCLINDTKPYMNVTCTMELHWLRCGVDWILGRTSPLQSSSFAYMGVAI
jgi:hypothetical protein